jgi:NTP pyrophosphatase (non-canonical NTP hydrolase)
MNVNNHAILHQSIKNFVMTLQEAQQNIDQWIKTTGVRYFSELTNMAILTEEVGEVARLMSRMYGDQSFKETDKGKNLSDELADVLWVLICIANQTGVDLTQALQRNFEKKNTRDGQRHQENEKLK